MTLGKSILGQGESSPCQVLVALAEPEDRKALEQILLDCGFESVSCSTSAEAASMLPSTSFSAVFCQDELPDGSVAEVLRVAQQVGRHLPVVVCARLCDIDRYLAVLDMGAFDYVVAPFRKDDIAWITKWALRKAAEMRSVHAA